MTQETPQNIPQHKEEHHQDPQKFNLFKYFKESYSEFKKVVWPKRPDAIRMTGFVVVFVAIFAIFIYGVDSIISLLFNLILVR